MYVCGELIFNSFLSRCCCCGWTSAGLNFTFEDTRHGSAQLSTSRSATVDWQDFKTDTWLRRMPRTLFYTLGTALLAQKLFLFHLRLPLETLLLLLICYFVHSRSSSPICLTRAVEFSHITKLKHKLSSTGSAAQPLFAGCVPCNGGCPNPMHSFEAVFEAILCFLT